MNFIIFFTLALTTLALASPVVKEGENKARQQCVSEVIALE
jgi:hypothetical protein